MPGRQRAGERGRCRAGPGQQGQAAAVNKGFFTESSMNRDLLLARPALTLSGVPTTSPVLRTVWKTVGASSRVKLPLAFLPVQLEVGSCAFVLLAPGSPGHSPDFPVRPTPQPMRATRRWQRLGPVRAGAWRFCRSRIGWSRRTLRRSRQITPRPPPMWSRSPRAISSRRPRRIGSELLALWGAFRTLTISNSRLRPRPASSSISIRGTPG